METDNKDTAKQRLADDLIYGAAEIAVELGVTVRQVYHLAENGRIPVGRWGKNLFAFRSELRRAIRAATTTAA